MGRRKREAGQCEAMAYRWVPEFDGKRCSMRSTCTLTYTHTDEKKRVCTVHGRMYGRRSYKGIDFGVRLRWDEGFPRASRRHD